MIFQNGECQILRGNEENLAIFTIILMAAFETKNVHSAFYYIPAKVN